MRSQTWTPLPPPSPQHLSGSSPCTSLKHAAPCVRHRLAIQFLHDSIHVRMPFFWRSCRVWAPQLWSQAKLDLHLSRKHYGLTPIFYKIDPITPHPRWVINTAKDLEGKVASWSRHSISIHSPPRYVRPLRPRTTFLDSSHRNMYRKM